MKASLSSKRKLVSVILGSKKMPLPSIHNKSWYYDRLTDWCKEHCVNYAFICHDRDIDEDGKQKFLHIHMALTMKSVGKGRNYPSLNTILNALAKEIEIDGMSINIDEMTSECGSIQYLIHKRDSEKAQYTEDEVITSYTCDELHTFMESDEQTLSVSYLLHVCKTSKNRIEIMTSIGLKYYKEYRLVINDILNDLRSSQWRKLICDGVIEKNN